MSTSLKKGTFFGSPCRKIESEGFVLTELVHDQKRCLPQHSHSAAFISLLLKGRYSETAGQLTVEYKPFGSVYHPPSFEHKDQIISPGTRLFTIEVDAGVLAGLDVGKVTINSPKDLSGGRQSWDVIKLYRSLSKQGTTALDIECLASEVFFSAVQVDKKVPGDSPALRLVIEYLHAHFRLNITLKRVAEVVRLHPVYLGYIFRTQTGYTLGEYVNRIRAFAAAEMLVATRLPICQIAVDSGFYDQSHFTHVFKHLSGFAPGSFRSQLSNVSFQELCPI